MSIIESSRHELRIAHGLTLMTPSPRGWEAFPTPGALTHTKITWAFSPPWLQVPGVTPGFPLCPWCFGHSLWNCAQHSPSLCSLFCSKSSQYGSVCRNRSTCSCLAEVMDRPLYFYATPIPRGLCLRLVAFVLAFWHLVHRTC